MSDDLPLVSPRSVRKGATPMVHIRRLHPDGMGTSKAICGAEPASGWSVVTADAPTCARCIARYEKEHPDELEDAIRQGWETAARAFHVRTGYLPTPEEARDIGTIGAMAQRLRHAGMTLDGAGILARHGWLDTLDRGRDIEALFGLPIRRTYELERPVITLALDETP